MAAHAHEHADGDDHGHAHAADGSCCDDHGHGHQDSEQKQHGHGHGHAHEHAEGGSASKEPEEEMPELSWKVVTMIYAVGSVICAIFGALQLFEVEQVKGFWLIFVVFPPALIYAFPKYRSQQALYALEKSGKKD